MRTAGIIGGLGPETTSNFYLEVIFSCFEKNNNNRPPMLIWNVPIPTKIEERFITKNEGEERYLPFLMDAAKRLEHGGADFIVIPCNSVHIFIDEVRNSVNIPVISIVEETVDFLNEKNLKNVGVLATSATIKQKLYDKKLTQNGIKTQIPNEFDQSRMGIIINNLVHSRHSDEDKKKLLNIIDKLSEKDVKTIILACTDLQLIIPKHSDIEIYDTMQILANATVREILK